jgi:hypothetical protein
LAGTERPFAFFAFFAVKERHSANLGGLRAATPEVAKNLQSKLNAPVPGAMSLTALGSVRVRARQHAVRVIRVICIRSLPPLSIATKPSGAHGARKYAFLQKRVE